jgi:hypothetical protein
MVFHVAMQTSAVEEVQAKFENLSTPGVVAIKFEEVEDEASGECRMVG